MRRRSYVAVCSVIAIVVCVVYRAVIWTIISPFAITTWTIISTNFGIPFATIILAIYGVGSGWWSHKRGLLDSRQKLIHDLHVSLQEFDQICRNTPDSLNEFYRLLSSANSALTRFSEANAQSRHVAPDYLRVVVDRLADALSRIAAGDYHTVGRVKEAILPIVSDLIILSSRYEETFRIRNGNRVSKFILRLHDPNEIPCQCRMWHKTSNSPLYSFCRKCGKPLNPRSTKYWVCPKPECHTKHPAITGRDYCFRCGTKLDKDAEHTYEDRYLSGVNYYETGPGPVKEGPSVSLVVRRNG